MTINDQQRRAIAFLTCSSRSSTHGATNFDEPGVMAALGKVRHLDLGTVTMAAMRCAADPSIKTPAMIGDPSSAVYRERVGPEVARRHPSPATACHTCGRDLTDTCCDQPTRQPTPSSDYAAHAARARNALHTHNGDHQ